MSNSQRHEVSRFPCGGAKYGPCERCKSQMDAYSIVTPFEHCRDADGEFEIPLMSMFVCPRCDHELTKDVSLTVKRGLSRTIQHHYGFEPTPHKAPHKARQAPHKDGLFAAVVREAKK